MKRLLATTALLGCLILTASAQTNKPVTPPTTAKLTYSINPAKPIIVNIVFTVQQLYDFITVNQAGQENITNSDKITAARAKLLLTDHKMVLDSLNNYFQRFIKADEDKFTADTLAARKKK